MKTVFCSFAFTGENENKVRGRMQKVIDALREVRVEAYCNLFDPNIDNINSPSEFIHSALKTQNNYDIVFVLQASERRSEGQLIEVGAALARSKYVINARHADVVGKSYMNTLADIEFTWDTEEDLVRKIKELNLNNL